MPIKVCLDAWRGISHSFSLVNQYQILELLKHPEITLAHTARKPLAENWNASNTNAGFNKVEQDLIDNLAAPSKEENFDLSIQILYPFIYPTLVSSKRVGYFMVTNYGLIPKNFVVEPQRLEDFQNGFSFILTPSNWSREKILSFGFPQSSVELLPHGVDTKVFRPEDKNTKNQRRSSIGIKEDDFIFLNLSAMSYNKGLDILLQSFARVVSKNKNCRLILKDHSRMYGVSGNDFLKDNLSSVPPNLQNDMLERLILISDNLSLTQMQSLYSCSDCYVAPYRAEGFNLPVLEASACGLGVLTSGGGPTDDFIENQNCKIHADKVSLESMGESMPFSKVKPPHNYMLNPSVDSLTEKMLHASLHPEGFKNDISSFGDQFLWSGVGKKLTEIISTRCQS